MQSSANRRAHPFRIVRKRVLGLGNAHRQMSEAPMLKAGKVLPSDEPM